MKTDRNQLEFLRTAVQHLASIDEGTPPQMVRLHSHFSLIFLQLYLERDAFASDGIRDGEHIMLK